MFITFEGVDRSGKSTQAAGLAAKLGEGVLFVREPGGTPAAEAIRRVLLDSSLELEDHAEALLYAAARAELVHRTIVPALDAGRTVIADRFVDSSLAYQGAGRDLGMDEIARINRWASGDLVPDITILLDIDPEIAALRDGSVDRIEAAGDALQRRTAAAYRTLAELNPKRYLVLDGTLPEDSLAQEILASIHALQAEAGADAD